MTKRWLQTLGVVALLLILSTAEAIAAPVVIRIRGRIAQPCKSKNLLMWYWEGNFTDARKIPINNGTFEIIKGTDDETYFLALEEHVGKQRFPVIVVIPMAATVGLYYTIYPENMELCTAVEDLEKYPKDARKRNPERPPLDPAMEKIRRAMFYLDEPNRLRVMLYDATVCKTITNDTFSTPVSDDV